MPNPSSVGESLASGIVDRVEALLVEADASRKPIEVDPYRGQLFELFVTAEGAGYLREGSDPDLSSDGLCRALSGGGNTRCSSRT